MICQTHPQVLSNTLLDEKLSTILQYFAQDNFALRFLKAGFRQALCQGQILSTHTIFDLLDLISLLKSYYVIPERKSPKRTPDSED